MSSGATSARSSVMDEAALNAAMDRYASGDSRAFAALHQALYPRLLAYLTRMSGSSATASDLVQETFLRMHRARATFAAGGAVLPWAYAIARNVRSTTRAPPASARRSGSRAIRVRRWSTAAAPTPSRRRSRPRPRAWSRGCWRACPPAQRDAFILIRYEGLSVQDAAAVLGATPTAVKLRAFRAYEALRAALDELRTKPARRDGGGPSPRRAARRRRRRPMPRPDDLSLDAIRDIPDPRRRRPRARPRARRARPRRALAHPRRAPHTAPPRRPSPPSCGWPPPSRSSASAPTSPRRPRVAPIAAWLVGGAARLRPRPPPPGARGCPRACAPSSTRSGSCPRVYALAAVLVARPAEGPLTWASIRGCLCLSTLMALGPLAAGAAPSPRRVPLGARLAGRGGRRRPGARRVHRRPRALPRHEPGPPPGGARRARSRSRRAAGGALGRLGGRAVRSVRAHR